MSLMVVDDVDGPDEAALWLLMLMDVNREQDAHIRFSDRQGCTKRVMMNLRGAESRVSLHLGISFSKCFMSVGFPCVVQ